MHVPCVISKILLFCPVSDSCVTNPLFTRDFPMDKIIKMDKYAAIRQVYTTSRYPCDARFGFERLPYRTYAT